MVLCGFVWFCVGLCGGMYGCLVIVSGGVVNCVVVLLCCSELGCGEYCCCLVFLPVMYPWIGPST